MARLVIAVEPAEEERGVLGERRWHDCARGDEGVAFGIGNRAHLVVDFRAGHLADWVARLNCKMKFWLFGVADKHGDIRL